MRRITSGFDTTQHTINVGGAGGASVVKPAGQRPAIAKAWTDDKSAKGMASQLWALEGSLSDGDVRLLESNLTWLSDAQVNHLAKNSDAATKSPKFARTKQVSDQVEKLYRGYWKAHSDDKVRLKVGGWVDEGVLTPAMYGKLQTVLLSGPISKGFALSVDWSSPLDFTKSPADFDKLFMTDADALKTMQAGIDKLPDRDRMTFQRASAYELQKIDQELPVRLVRELGVETFAAVNGVDASGTPEAVATELSRHDGVDNYLRMQRVPGGIATYTPTAAGKARIAKAAAAVEAADDFATTNGIDLASKPEKLAKARNLYSKAAAQFRNVLSHDAMAIQDPDVKAWMGRRAKSLLVRTAVIEAESGTCPNKFVRFVRRLARKIPGVKTMVNAPGLAEPKLLEGLKTALGFDPAAPLDGAQKAKLIERMNRDVLFGETSTDPLTKVMLDPQQAKANNVHVLFAPGVVPIAGVLDEAFASLKSRLGVETEIAHTGLFHSEQDNADDMRTAFNKIVAKDPDAKVVILGYSQGAANALVFLDELRSGSPADRASADRVAGFVSLYGAHNGSTAAEDGIQLLKTVADHLPWSQQILQVVSGIRGLGKMIAGGVDSLKRSTRHRFWQTANVPTDIPYMSICAHTQPNEVPDVLKKGYADMKTTASKQGLQPTNDTQVLASDAPMGNDDTRAGKAVRKNNITIPVTGHHWNPLRARHMKFDMDPEKYAYPKTPQIESNIQLMLELGLV